MRLIDADQFKGKVIASHTGCGVIKLIAINDVPTAYDQDKVVEQLGNLKDEKVIGSHLVMIQEAIEIVKGGGVDGN